MISSLLQKAGVCIGEKLIAANSANPRGYFEDVDFYEFHEHLLHQRGQTYLHVDSNFTFQPTGPEVERACQLLAERSHRPLWGWKDPRTSLFLSFWHQLLPDACFLFVYRHPVEVLLSLLRRGEFDANPSPLDGLQAWQVYNSNIQAFCVQHPDRCLLVHIGGVIQHPSKFSEMLRKKLQIDSVPGPEAFAQIYHGNELQKTSFSADLDVVLPRISPGLLKLYQRLNQEADLPSDGFEVDSSASQQLASLVQMTKNLPEPMNWPVKHSLVQIFLSSIAPELTERMLVRFHDSAKSSQQKVDYLWLLVQQNQRLHAENAQELDLRSAQITEQQSELDRRLTQITEQQLELDRWLAQITEQRLELDRQRTQITEQQAELYRQVTQIDALSDELKSIYHTPVGKVIRSYRNLKEKWKRAA